MRPGYPRDPFATLRAFYGAHSSSGLGHRPLTAAARVRIPYGPSLDSPRTEPQLRCRTASIAFDRLSARRYTCVVSTREWFMGAPSRVSVSGNVTWDAK